MRTTTLKTQIDLNGGKSDKNLEFSGFLNGTEWNPTLSAILFFIHISHIYAHATPCRVLSSDLRRHGTERIVDLPAKSNRSRLALPTSRRGSRGQNRSNRWSHLLHFRASATPRTQNIDFRRFLKSPHSHRVLDRPETESTRRRSPLYGAPIVFVGHSGMSRTTVNSQRQ